MSSNKKADISNPPVLQGETAPAIPAAAQRALAEARQRQMLAPAAAPPVSEIGGRDGPDPVRFGDWEKNGIAVDF